jgi:tetratricopeptide (TPR) repeat protein
MDPNSSPNITNAGSRLRIPAARRRLMLVAAAAIIAGATAAAVVIATRGGDTHHRAVKPLGGRPPLVLDLPGPAVTGGNAAVYAAARQRLSAGDVRLAVARAIMAYNPAQRMRTVTALERLPQKSPAVEFALGLAQLWAGEPTAAERTFNRVKQLNPYGFYGTNADNLLYLDTEAQGYPPYFPPPSPHRSLRALKAAVVRTPKSAAAWLALAAGLQRSDRLEALGAARKAEDLDPQGVPEAVAVAVLGFDKANPMASINALNTVSSQAKGKPNPELLFHLGLLYIWIREPQDAAAQFAQVADDAPHSYYAKVAAVFSSCLSNSPSCPVK